MKVSIPSIINKEKKKGKEMLQWKRKTKWKVTVKAKMYMRITEWKLSVKIGEQKAWKSKRNGGKERMNPQEKAL